MAVDGGERRGGMKQNNYQPVRRHYALKRTFIELNDITLCTLCGRGEGVSCAPESREGSVERRRQRARI